MIKRERERERERENHHYGMCKSLLKIYASYIMFMSLSRLVLSVIMDDLKVCN